MKFTECFLPAAQGRKIGMLKDCSKSHTSIKRSILCPPKVQCYLLQLLRVCTNEHSFWGNFSLFGLKFFFISSFSFTSPLSLCSPFPKIVAADASKERTRGHSSIFLPPKGKGGVFYFLCLSCATSKNNILLCTQKQ